MVPTLAVQTYALAVTIVALVWAVQVPLPVEMTALVMVGLVLRWSLGRQTRAALSTDDRVAELEEKVDATRGEIDRQRHYKHEFRNQLSGVYATMMMVREAAKGCSCAAFDPLLPVLDQIILTLKATIDLPTAPMEEP